MDWYIYVGSYGEDCVQAFVSQENWVIVGTFGEACGQAFVSQENWVIVGTSVKFVCKLLWAKKIEL